jgi:hypothetical protein
MPQYTVEQLSNEGPPYAMALLLRCLKAGEPFVTYGAIRDELQYQLNIERIFSTQIGYVAGSLMNQILEVDPKAPLINVLITRGDGTPGEGVGSYIADRYRKPKLRNWKTIPRNIKLEIVERERDKVFAYSRWREINDELFGESYEPRLAAPQQNDDPAISGGEYGGTAESKEHKQLKKWVAKNPRAIGLANSFGEGDIEHLLMSGDEVDVMFKRGSSYRAVEVKSSRSSDADLTRGIYQCVKYREVKRAEHAPFEIDCRSILVIERDLPERLKKRARVLDVLHKVVSLQL